MINNLIKRVLFLYYNNKVNTHESKLTNQEFISIWKLLEANLALNYCANALTK